MDPLEPRLERIALLAGAAEERLRAARSALAVQGRGSQLRPALERAAATHHRAARLQARGVTCLLRLREMQTGQAQPRARWASVVVRDIELR